MNKKFSIFLLCISIAFQCYAIHFYPVGRTLAKQFLENTLEEIIQINPISKFKQTTRYLGGRFGISDQPPAAQKLCKKR